MCIRDSSSSLRVTYSDIGDQDGAVILFCGGLFGSRYTLAHADELAKRYRVRLVSPDKPGIGGSDPVELDQKLKTWLDVVPALMKELGVKHVSLVGHSSGAIYILNTLLYLRDILQPERPYAAVITPWVHPSRSGVTESRIGELLPGWALKLRYSFVHALSRYKISSALGPSTARPGVEVDKDRAEWELDNAIMSYAHEEDVEGIAQEALFCLKRGPEHMWGQWKDYDEYVPLLKKQEAEKKQAPKLSVEIFFAESDNSSGEQGSKWFDECWKTSGIQDHVHSTSCTIPGTTHENITRMEAGVIESIFSRVTR